LKDATEGCKSATAAGALFAAAGAALIAIKGKRR